MIKKYSKLIRFVFVAATYNLLGYGFFSGLLYLGVNYLISSFLSFIFSVILSFFMNKKLVFVVKNHDNRMITKYILFYVVLLVINLSILHIFVYFFSLTPYIAQILVTAIFALISYNAMRVLIF